MSLSLILFVAALAGLLGFLYIRAGKKRGKDNSGSGGDGGFSPMIRTAIATIPAATAAGMAAVAVIEEH